MDGYKSRCITKKRRRESSPQRGYRAIVPGIRLTHTLNHTPTGNSKREDRYVSKDSGLFLNGTRQEHYKCEKAIPTGPRNQRDRKFRPSQSLVGSDSRKNLCSGLLRCSPDAQKTTNPSPGLRPLLPNGGAQEKPKNIHGLNLAVRGCHKTFGIRSLESQEEYRKKSIAAQRKAQKEQRAPRKARPSGTLQREYGVKNKFSLGEPVLTGGDERNKERYSQNLSPPSVAPDNCNPLNVSEQPKLFHQGNLTSPTRGPNSELAKDGRFNKEANSDSLFDYSCLPPPISEPSPPDRNTDSVPALSSYSLPTYPRKGMSPTWASHPLVYKPDQPRLSTSTSTSAMSISSGNSPTLHSTIQGHAHNDPGTNSRTTLSPPHSTISSSSRGKLSACILCNGPAAPPLKALVKCIHCRRNYHTHCHSPGVTMTSGKFDVDITSWVCSRCTKNQRNTSLTAPTSVKSQGVNQTCGFMRSSTPLHKRRKLGVEGLPVLNGNDAFLNQNFAVKTGENAKSVHSSHSVQVSKQSPHPIETCETMGRGLLEPSLAVKDSHEVEKSAYKTKRAPDFAPDADTVATSQVRQKNPDMDRPRSTSDVNMRMPVGQGDSSSLQLGDSASDEEVSMDLDSITESARSPSPVLGKRSSQTERHLGTDPVVTSIQHDTLSIQRGGVYSAGTEVESLVEERTEKGDNSPPYSPRLESEVTNSPTVGYPPSMQLRVESDFAKDTQSVVQNPLVPVQLPLTVAPSGPAVSPEIPLHVIFPTTTSDCANCKVQFSIFVDVVQAGGKILCPSCLLRGQTPPQATISTPVRRESIKDTKASHRKGRPTSLSIQTRSPDTGCFATFTSKATRSSSYKSSSQPLVENGNSMSAEEPLRTITTSQEFVEWHQMRPEIVPSNSRFHPGRDVTRSSDEKLIGPPKKDSYQTKEGPKRKLTVKEYTMRHKEKEKGVSKKNQTAAMEYNSVNQEAGSVGKSRLQETSELPEGEITKSAVTPGKTSRAPRGTSIPKTTPTERFPSETILTNPAVLEETDVLREMQEKFSEEVETWKRKFEEQQGFVSNYVKHNAKIMGKLSAAEQQRAFLEKKTATLEAEITVHKKLHEQLLEENEQLKQQKLHQEEKAAQAHIAAELEDEARTRVKNCSPALKDLIECNERAGQDNRFLMKNVYQGLNFNIDDPLRGVVGVLSNLPEKPPAIIPKPRYSATRKSEVLNFNFTNLRKLHLHREVDRTLSVSASSSLVTSTVRDKLHRGTSSGETNDGKSISFEEFAQIPSNMVPVIKDGVLTFRTGQLNPRTRRLERKVPHFKVGRDVPGELGGLH